MYTLVSPTAFYASLYASYGDILQAKNKEQLFLFHIFWCWGEVP